MINLIPAGTKNLHNLFPGIIFRNVGEYYVEAITNTNEVLATTPIFTMECMPEKSIRIHFLNSCGQYDAVNFRDLNIVHDDKSDEYKRGTAYPLNKTDAESERFNIRSNDTYTAICYVREEQTALLKELMDSPKMFLEWTGIEGQDDSFIPVLKLEGKLETVKYKDDFRYACTVSFTLSNEYFTFRN